MVAVEELVVAILLGLKGETRGGDPVRRVDRGVNVGFPKVEKKLRTAGLQWWARKRR